MRYTFFTSFVLCCALLPATGSAQQVFSTSHFNNMRSAANTNETLLTPENVNKGSFGKLWSFPVDYQVLAQPLYVPNVTMPDQSVHNVMYVVTQADSVYAIDADDGTQLWYASMLNGGQTASGQYLPCGVLGGFNQEGIVGTPVIDTNSNTMYLVAKTVNSGTVYHSLHALDIATGNDRAGSPIQISASSTSIKGNVTYFNSLHQKNRPGLLLLNGVIYMGFGSNGCNDHNTGWVLAYDENTLQQLGAFNTSPDIGLTSIWQTGNGLAADDEGYVYVSTAESANYGGQSYSNSILKLALTQSAESPTGWVLDLSNFFTPWSVAYLNTHDLDISSGGPVVLPDQSGLYPVHQVIASGKQGVVYVLDRDHMGQFQPGDSQAIQEFPLVNNGELMASPAYWNGLAYFTPGGSPVQSYQILNQPNGPFFAFAQTSQRYTGAHSPSISANGNTNGILWLISGNNLDALDALSLKLLYGSNQVKSRDTLPKVAHFATQTVANGRVYVATQTSLETYGLLHILSITGGNNQTAQVLSPLPAPLQIETENPYTGAPIAGVIVTFTDGNKGGTFDPPSAVSDANGAVSTIYTFPRKAGTYTITVSASNFGSITATEVATPAAARGIFPFSGARQTGPAGSVLPNPIVVQAVDPYGNGVPGVTVNFVASNNGFLNPPSATTDGRGLASTTLQLPTTVGTVTVTASSSGFKNVKDPEYSVAGPAASSLVNGGNNQTGAAGTTLPQPITVLVVDQYANPVPGVAVTFSDNSAGGSFSNANPENTGPNGIASQVYTLPAVPGTVTITGTAAGVANPAVFTETAQ